MNDNKLHEGARTAFHSETRELEPVAPSAKRPGSSTEHAGSLLDLALALPLEAGTESVAQTFAEALADLIGDCGVGIRLREPRDGKQRAICRQRNGKIERIENPPTHIFERPEKVIALDAGSTLHIAPRTEAALSDAKTVELIERAADVLNVSLLRARTLTDSRDSFDEIRRLQQRLIHSEKLASLGRIVAGLVHELTNPLTSILAYTEFLRRRALARSNIDEEAMSDVDRLGRITEAAERVLGFSKDIVTYSRPSDDVPAGVCLEQVVQKALIFCDHELSSHGVAVELELESELPPVRGVFGQLTQVLVNLITNAVHAMPVKVGRMSIRARSGKTSVLLELADNGCGMDEVTLKRAFEPFFTTKCEGLGTGLGLSIVRDIITAHEGKLGVTSSPGQGTVFSIELPIAR